MAGNTVTLNKALAYEHWCATESFKGIPLEEARIELLKRVRAYPWKNDSIKK